MWQYKSQKHQYRRVLLIIFVSISCFWGHDHCSHFCHCFIINPVSMLFIKFSYQSFTLPGLVLYQGVLIRNLLEDSFFKCRERLVKGQCNLTVDILTSLCGWRFWNLSLSSVTCWPKSEASGPCIDSYKLWACYSALQPLPPGSSTKSGERDVFELCILV